MSARHGGFDVAADTYDAARPGYPPAVLDALDAAVGGLAAALVLDVGAGTGISTRLLAERAGRVVAIDAGPRMLTVARRRAPGLAAAVGLGEALPVRDGAADVVTYAQAFHWTDPERSVPEALRVLRRGGVLALWWNVLDRAGCAWLREQDLRLRGAAPLYERLRGMPDSAHVLRDRFGLDVEVVELPWRRRQRLDEHVTELRSKSYVIALDEQPRTALLAAEREALRPAAVDGVLDVPYISTLHLARRP